MEHPRGVRQSRLERRVARVQSRLALQSAQTVETDVAEGLERLRALAKAAEGKGERREARLCTEAVLGHHRDVAKMLKPDVAVDARQINLGCTREEYAELVSRGGSPVDRFLDATKGE